MAIDRIRVTEQASAIHTFTLRDPTGTVVPLVNLLTATLTLYDLLTYVPGTSPEDGILNARAAQDVKNAHHVTIHPTSGLVTWELQPADNPIVTARRQVERHRAEFRCVVDVGVSPAVDPVTIDYQLEIEVVHRRTAG